MLIHQSLQLAILRQQLRLLLLQLVYVFGSLLKYRSLQTQRERKLGYLRCTFLAIESRAGAAKYTCRALSESLEELNKGVYDDEIKIVDSAPGETRYDESDERSHSPQVSPTHRLQPASAEERRDSGGGERRDFLFTYREIKGFYVVWGRGER